MWLISRWWRLENYQKKVTFYLVADHTIICVISPLLCSRLTPLMMSPIMATQWQMEVKLHPHTSLVFLKRSIQCGWDGQQNVIYIDFCIRKNISSDNWHHHSCYYWFIIVVLIFLCCLLNVKRSKCHILFYLQ